MPTPAIWAQRSAVLLCHLLCCFSYWFKSTSPYPQAWWSGCPGDVTPKPSLLTPRAFTPCQPSGRQTLHGTGQGKQTMPGSCDYCSVVPVDVSPSFRPHPPVTYCQGLSHLIWSRSLLLQSSDTSRRPLPLLFQFASFLSGSTIDPSCGCQHDLSKMPIGSSQFPHLK